VMAADKEIRNGGIGIIYVMLMVHSESAGTKLNIPGGALRKVLSLGMVQSFMWSKALVGMVTTRGCPYCIVSPMNAMIDPAAGCCQFVLPNAG